MKRAHIAFVSFPHHPHVNPTLPIVSTLVRRGFRVTYATSEKFAARVAAVGAEVVLCPPFEVSTLSQGEDEKDRFSHPFCRLAIRTLKKLTSFYENDHPDVIVYDLLAFAG